MEEKEAKGNQIERNGIEKRSTIMVATKGPVAPEKPFYLSDLKSKKEIWLPVHVYEIDEKISKEGLVITTLKESEINKLLRTVFKIKPRVAIICLCNSGANPIHEKSLYNILKNAGIPRVVCSFAPKTELD